TTARVDIDEPRFERDAHFDQHPVNGHARRARRVVENVGHASAPAWIEFAASWANEQAERGCRHKRTAPPGTTTTTHTTGVATLNAPMRASARPIAAASPRLPE